MRLQAGLAQLKKQDWKGIQSQWMTNVTVLWLPDEKIWQSPEDFLTNCPRNCPQSCPRNCPRNWPVSKLSLKSWPWRQQTKQITRSWTTNHLLFIFFSNARGQRFPSPFGWSFGTQNASPHIEQSHGSLSNHQSTATTPGKNLSLLYLHLRCLGPKMILFTNL